MRMSTKKGEPNYDIQNNKLIEKQISVNNLIKI